MKIHYKIIVGIIIASILGILIPINQIPVVAKAEAPYQDPNDKSIGICALCGKQLYPEYVVDSETGEQVLYEAHSEIWIHNPVFIQEDIKITVHTDCYDKVIKKYPDFGNPTQEDYADPKFPTIDANGNITKKKLSSKLIDPVKDSERAKADPVYIACANANFNTNTTWYTVDSTSYLDSETGTTEVATAASWGSSSTFTPGAITIDGIAVKLASRTTTPSTYTVSVRLYNTTDSVAVAGTTVTINVSDLPSCTSTTNEGGWVFFGFTAAPVALEAAHNYRVEAQESNASANVYLWRNGTASNWSRMLRTTTSPVAAPTTGDVLHIMKEWSAAATGVARTVTMDNTAATDFGTGTDGSAALTISNGGTLNYGTTVATNYYLKLSGNLIVYNGGTLTIGTVGSEIPRDSTAVLEFDPVADGGMGLIARNGATVTMQGLSRTVGNTTWETLINSNAAVNDTHIHIADSTGWKDNDYIAIASTTRTYSQCEKGQLNGDDGGSPINIDGFGGVGGGLAYAHNGTVIENSLGQAEVILLTRNVRMRSATSTIMTYFSIKQTSTVDVDWTELYYLGENATDKRGIDVETNTGSCNIQYSALHDFEDYGLRVYNATGDMNNITFSNNGSYNLSSVLGYPAQIGGATTGNSITFASNIIMLSDAGSNYGLALWDLSDTVINNTVCGINGYGIYYSEAGAIGGTFTNNVAHSCARYGHYVDNPPKSGTTLGCSAWRNNSYGLYTDSAWSGVSLTGTFFGNTTSNVYFLTYVGDTTILNATLDSDASYSTTNGLAFGNPLVMDVTINNCVLGNTVNHTNDIYFGNLVQTVQMTLIDTKLASGVEFSGYTTYAQIGSYIRSQNHDQDVTKQYTFYPYGQAEIDTATFKTASPSVKFTPSSATVALTSTEQKWLIPCTAGESVTVTIWGMWTSANTPSTLPSVTLSGCGIVTDTDTMTVATATWEQLSVSGTPDASYTPTTGGMLELTISCLKSSSATTVNFDDIEITYGGGGSKDTGGLDYWWDGFPGCYKIVFSSLNYHISKILGILITDINKLNGTLLSILEKILGIDILS